MPEDKVSQEVEKIIQKALKDKATELDLSLKRLTSLPEWLGNLSQLQSLDQGGVFI